VEKCTVWREMMNSNMETEMELTYEMYKYIVWSYANVSQLLSSFVEILESSRQKATCGIAVTQAGVISVLDLVRQIRHIVLVRRTFSSGKPQGVGILEWGGDGDVEISLRATWDQGGRDPITPRRVSK
jgi:hypothetical protein